ncbi:MAG: TolC family outer membrane protein [Pseudomonadota bacterium]
MNEGERMGWCDRLKRTGSAIALGAALAAGGTAARAETLSDALVQAYQSSPILEQQRFLLRATDEDVAVAVSALRPSVDFIASYGKVRTSTDTDTVDLAGGGTFTPDGTSTETTSSLALVLSYTLLDAGQRQLRIAAEKESVLAARFGLIDFEQGVLLTAVEAYLGLREAVLAVEVSESNLNLLREELRATQDRFEVGEVTRTDVAIAESSLAASISALAAARGQVDISRELYRQAIGVLPTGVLAPPPPPPDLPPSLERAQALALQIHPEILSAQHDIVALRLLADETEANRLPSIGLSSNFTVSRPDTVTAGVTVTGTVPIYSGGALSALNREAIAVAQAAQSNLNTIARAITQGVGTSWAELQIAQAQIVATREGVRAARLAFEGFQEEARLGARTTIDVLDAEQDLIDARLALINAQTDADLAVYSVLDSVGLLTTDHLGLAVQRYDPSTYYNQVSNAPAISPSNQGGRLDRVLRRFGRD